MTNVIELSNGYDVLAATLLSDEVEGKDEGPWSYGLVIAKLHDNNLHPYVVWTVERHELNGPKWSALHGDYCPDLGSAKEAYVKRLASFSLPA